jgi:hypothetical protein
MMKRIGLSEGIQSIELTNFTYELARTLPPKISNGPYMDKIPRALKNPNDGWFT